MSKGTKDWHMDGFVKWSELQVKGKESLAKAARIWDAVMQDDYGAYSEALERDGNTLSEGRESREPAGE